MTISKIGRYELKSEIGRGGMASVVLAYDPNFERDVAIKILPPTLLNDPQFRTRFAREARMVALLEHPAILPVYDFGEDEGRPYIVMRFMSGGSLADKLKTGPLTVAETAGIIARIAPALDVAHQRGIIHRDLKPANILFDQYGNGFLSDFGIARMAEGGSATLTGSLILGTPAYMSPEQARGDANIDGRSDIYSLGATLFEMLTGKAPYQADTPMGQVMKHITEPVPNILVSRTDLPQGVQAVIEKSMAKDRNDRFATANDLAIMLTAASQGKVSAGATVQVGGGLQTVQTSPPSSSTLTPPGGKSPEAVPPTQMAQADYAGAASPPVATGGKTAITGPGAGAAAPSVQPMPKKGGISPVVLGIGGFFILAVIIAGVFIFGQINKNRANALIFSQTQTAVAMVAGKTTVPEKPTNTAEIPPTQTSAPSATAPAATATATTQASPTAAPPSATPTEAPSPTPEPAKAPVIGGADKVAYLSGNDIYVANLDGSEFVRLTDDHTQKTELAWGPEGDTILYLLGKCVNEVNIVSRQNEQLFCLNFIETFSSFSLSPDGAQMALSIDSQLYLVPFDRAKFAEVKSRRELANMAACKDFAPLERELIRFVRWSEDSERLATITLIPLGGIRADIVRVFSVTQCLPNPRVFDNFPGDRFTVDGYDKNPRIQNFGWNGNIMFAFTNSVRNGGFGDLYIYNMEKFRAQRNINPIEDRCCYRDPVWSPDGSHLLVAFQDILEGSNSVTRLYLLSYGTLGTGTKYEPLPLPDINSPRESPLPILRPAR